MDKLFHLKNYVTIIEAANHLSAILENNVSAADIYQLALDSHLKISIMLPTHITAKPCRIFPTEFKRIDTPDGEIEVTCYIPQSGNPEKGEVLSPETTVEYSDVVLTLQTGEVFDLPMIGNEYNRLLNAYLQATGNNSVRGDIDKFFRGDFIQRNGRFYQIQKLLLPEDGGEKYIPGQLPEESVFVVRAEALSDFVQTNINKTAKTKKNDSSGKTLHTKERQSLYKIILALAKQAECDLTHIHKTAESISHQTQEMGIDVSPNTIAKYLNEAKNEQ